MEEAEKSLEKLNESEKFLNNRERKFHSLYEFDVTWLHFTLAAKRNRYQRQKSLMLLEMESQHAKGLPSVPLNPH
ncbi:hypothetical protein F383_07007 [Gossypium arboreum]|uniref:Uncharacterized protein n=1 Tax=Gossypium arboreum TaxID=29729 RepID=A0A0B0N5G4_GOSAR|nr:hypothetical protein F383_07007 [Gossypium arboreum]